MNKNNKHPRLALIAGISVLAFNTSFAGDMGYYSGDEDLWNGFYAGLQLGGANVNQSWSFTNANYFNTLGSLLLGTNFSLSKTGFIGGLNLGYNFMMEDFILGLEGDFSAANLSATKQSPFFTTDSIKGKLNSISTIVARFAFPQDQWLFNVNAGLAIADVSLTFTDNLTGIQATSSSRWNTGWTAGLGVDYAINSCFSLGLGYNYSQINANNKTAKCAQCGTGVGFGAPTVSSNMKVQTLLLKGDYWFNA